jgi:hypothetical protein
MSAKCQQRFTTEREQRQVLASRSDHFNVHLRTLSALPRQTPQISEACRKGTNPDQS